MKMMKKNGLKLLKVFHVLFSAFWGGTVFCTFISMIVIGNQSEQNIKSVLLAVQNFDYITIPCIFGLIITGIIYSVFTEWGFKKYYWILIKWIIALALPIICGTLVEDAAQKLIDLSIDPNFNRNTVGFNDALLNTQIAYGAVILLFVFVIYLSICKPFGKIKTLIRYN